MLKSCLVRSASYFIRFRPKVLRMYTFTHVLGYFLGLFCVRYLRILLSTSLRSVGSFISLSQPHIVVRKSLFRLPKSGMLTSSPVAWKFSFSFRLYKNCTYHQVAPLFFLCKSCLTNLLCSCRLVSSDT